MIAAASSAEAQALKGVGVTADMIMDLERFGNTVAAQNQVMNLVGPSFEAEFWKRHAMDSAQLFHVEQNARVWADIGSGAGFPGIVLAMMLKARPGGQIHLIESQGKRARFLRSVQAMMALPATVHHQRAESLQAIPSVDVVTARACAPLDRLLSWSGKFLLAGATGLFLKGRTAEDEIAVARKGWTFDFEIIKSLTDDGGRLVRITGFEGRR